MIPRNHLSPEWQNALGLVAPPAGNTGSDPAPVAAPAAAAPSAQRGQSIDNGLAARGATLLTAGRQADPGVSTGARLLGNFGALG